MAEWHRRRPSKPPGRTRREAWVREQKDVPCSDCGQRYPYYVMQFDHVGDDKVANITTLLRTCGWEKLRAEVAKCDVVCANCHSERSHQRTRTAPCPASPGA
jgi:hypothetical protein